MSIWIYGVHPVEEAIRMVAGLVEEVCVLEARRNHMSMHMAACEVDIPLRVVDSKKLDRWASDGNHQGVAARLQGFPYHGLSEVLDRCSPDEHALIVILDGVEDPHNLGAILRNAAAFGAKAVIIAKNRAVGVTPAVVRASAGLVFRTPVVRVTNIAATLLEMGKKGWWRVGGVMDGEPVWSCFLARKVALVLGSEGTGIRRLVRSRCDQLAAIPMAGEVESLNASVAAGIMMYEWKRQLNQ